MAAPPDPLRPRLVDAQKRVILPVEVLDALDVRPGDYVAFRVDRDGVRLHRVRMSLD